MEVEIHRKIVENTHDNYLNGRQADKAVWELATRGSSTAVRQLTVDTLNMANRDVALVQNSEKAARVRTLMKGYEAPTPVTTPVKKKGAKGKQQAEEEDEDNSQDPDRDTGEKHAIEDERALIAETGISLKEVRKMYKRLSPDAKKSFRFDDWLVFQVLQLDAAKVYTLEDLEDPNTLERGLRLLYLRRLGRAQDLLLDSIHVNYDAVHGDLGLVAQETLALDDSQARGIRRHLDYYDHENTLVLDK